MAETTTPANPQAGEGQQPQAGTPANPQAGAANPSSQTSQPSNGDPASEPITLEKAKEMRQEAAALRKRLKDFEDAQAAAELAKLGDLEKTQKQLDAATKQAEAYRQRIAAYAVQIEAQKLGIIDPEVAATLIRDKLDIGDDGTPSNAADLLKELIKVKPYLKAPEPAAGSQSGQQSQAPKPNPGTTNPGRGTPANPGTTQTTPGQMARFGTGQRLFTTGRQ